MMWNLALMKSYYLIFLESTQKDSLNELQRRIGSEYKEKLIKRIVSQIGQRGIIDIMRNGVSENGVKFDLIYNKPNTSKNPDLIIKYQGNIFPIIRQLYYGVQHNNSLDIVIFINGFPLITMELKNPLTGQNVYNAIEQYIKMTEMVESPCLSGAWCILH